MDKMRFLKMMIKLLFYLCHSIKCKCRWERKFSENWICVLMCIERINENPRSCIQVGLEWIKNILLRIGISKHEWKIIMQIIIVILLKSFVTFFSVIIILQHGVQQIDDYPEHFISISIEKMQCFGYEGWTIEARGQIVTHFVIRYF